MGTSDVSFVEAPGNWAMSNFFLPPASSAFTLPAIAPHDLGWAYRVNTQVGGRFEAFVSRLNITQPQRDEATTKVSGIVRHLNQKYWGVDSDDAHFLIEGSWGKDTQTRPPRDVDLLYVLPYDVYQRFEVRQGNKQSQLVLEIKGTLKDLHQNTRMRGDGQVVIVDFANAHGVEVLPAFELQNGQYCICITKNGGSYKIIDPVAEIEAIEQSDASSSRTTREFVRILKRWQWHCNVVDYLKSFQIELIAIDFLATVGYSLTTRCLYDYLVRDFFGYLVGKKNGWVTIPGTHEIVWLGDAWLSRAQTAYDRAVKASRYENDEMPYSARGEWQKIFGTDIQ